MTPTIRFAAPLSGLLLLGAIAGLAGYATADTAPSRPTPAEVAEAESSITRGVIREVAGDRLTLTSGDNTVSVQLAPAVAIEALVPISRDQLRSGDWLNAGAVPHERTVFVVTGLVVIPQMQLAPR